VSPSLREQRTLSLKRHSRAFHPRRQANKRRVHRETAPFGRTYEEESFVRVTILR